ncbi:BppU family phage baseplate upper protein [Enterococcus faecium]|uniref:BppU family phage baseplate upper protein n=1 Tax=Enterococcus faecium TaxID=1352 RepID=UPI002156FBE9|nr:BppU family phage baseplate upper protein [Enterococcus faecium]
MADRKVGEITVPTEPVSRATKITGFTFKSYDKNAGVLQFNIENQDGSPTDLIDATVRLFMYIYQGEEKKEFPIFDNQIITESYMQGIVKYPIPDMLLSYEGKVDANVYIDFPDGSHTDNLAFTFNIEKSVIDDNVQLNGEYYFKDFQQLLDGVKQEATDAVNEVLAKVDSSTAKMQELEQRIDEQTEIFNNADVYNKAEIEDKLEPFALRTDIDTLEIKKADNEYVKTVEDMVANMPTATPAETFASEAALRSKYPNGNTRPMLVLESDGKTAYTYLWNGSSWVKGVLYQSAGIADQSVDPQKLITKQAGVNLINPFKVTRGAYIDGTNGNVVAGSSGTGLNCATDFFDVIAGETYHKLMFGNVIFYSTNSAFVGNVTTQEKNKFVVPSGAAKARISYRQADESIAFCARGTEYRQYEPYVFEQVQVIEDQTLKKITPTWLLGSIHATTNEEISAKNRIRTAALRVKKNTRIKLNSENKIQIMRYDPDTLAFIDAPLTFNPFVGREWISDGNYSIRLVLAYADDREITDPVDNDLTQSLIIDTISDKELEMDGRLKQIESKVQIVPQDFPKMIKMQQHDRLWGNISSHCFVGEEFWVFTAADYSEDGERGRVIRYTFDENDTLIFQSEFKHNWNHVNSVGYSAVNDVLVCSSFVGDNTPVVDEKYEIYLIQNVSSFKDLPSHESEALLADNALKITVPFEWGNRMNATFGESNGGKENIIYYITNDNRDVRKILLGQGPNNLGSGQFLDVKNDREFNGTYKLLNHYHTDNSFEVNQGSWYFNGALYLGLGHEGLYYQKSVLLKDGSILTELFKDEMYDDAGNLLFQNLGFSGITINNGRMYCGLNASGMTPGYILIYEL